MIVVSLLLILVAVTLLVLGLTSGSSVLLIGSIVASLLAAVALVVGARHAAAARAAVLDSDSGPILRDEDPDDLARSQFPAGHFRDADFREDGAVPSFREDGSFREAGSFRGEGAFREGGAGPASGGLRSGGPRSGQRDTANVSGAGPGTYRSAASGSRPDRTDAAAPHGEGDSSRGEGPERSRRAGAGGGGLAVDDEPPDEPAPQPVSAADLALLAQMDADVLVVDGRPRYHVPGCASLVEPDSETLPVSEAVELGFTPCGQCNAATQLLSDAHLS